MAVWTPTPPRMTSWSSVRRTFTIRSSNWTSAIAMRRFRTSMLKRPSEMVSSCRSRVSCPTMVIQCVASRRPSCWLANRRRSTTCTTTSSATRTCTTRKMMRRHHVQVMNMTPTTPTSLRAQTTALDPWLFHKTPCSIRLQLMSSSISRKSSPTFLRKPCRVKHRLARLTVSCTTKCWRPSQRRLKLHRKLLQLSRKSLRFRLHRLQLHCRCPLNQSLSLLRKSSTLFRWWLRTSTMPISRMVRTWVFFLKIFN